MPRNTPTFAEIAADFRLWGEYYDPYGHDSPEHWASMTLRDRLEKLQAAFEEHSAARDARRDGRGAP